MRFRRSERKVEILPRWGAAVLCPYITAAVTANGASR